MSVIYLPPVLLKNNFLMWSSHHLSASHLYYSQGCKEPDEWVLTHAYVPNIVRVFLAAWYTLTTLQIHFLNKHILVFFVFFLFVLFTLKTPLTTQFKLDISNSV